MTTLQPSPLLRRALLADGLVGVLTAVHLLLLADGLSALLELPRQLLFGSGLALLPLAAWLTWLARRETLSRLQVWTVLALNALWVINSLLLLLSGWVAPNLFGYVWVIGQAIVVLVFIELEWLGLKRSPLASPSFAHASAS